MSKCLALSKTLCLASIVLFSGSVAFARGTDVKVIGENCFIVEERCDDIVRPTEWGFELSGMKFGQVDKGVVVRLDPEVVEHIRNIAVLVDTLQHQYCKEIQAISECNPYRDRDFANYVSCDQALKHLIVLAQCYSEKRLRIKFELLKWVLRTAPMLENLESKKLLPKNVDEAELTKQVSTAVDFALKELEITKDSEKYTEMLLDPFLNKILKQEEQKK
jgi:hypothetical protein